MGGDHHHHNHRCCTDHTAAAASLSCAYTPLLLALPVEQTSKSVGEDDAAYGQAAAAVKCAAAAREGVSQAQATKRALQAAADEEAKANGEDAEYALIAAPWHSNLQC